MTLTNEDAHPLYLYTVLLRQYTSDFFRWLPETRAQVLKEQYGDIPDSVTSKVEALSTLLSTDSAFMHWPVFEKVCVCLNGTVLLPFTMQKPSIGDTIHAVRIIKTINNNPFEAEVCRYMAAVLLNDGVIYAPPPIIFVQDYITEFLNSKNQPDVHQVVKERFEYMVKNPALADTTLTINGTDVQVALLLVAHEYATSQFNMAAQQLSEFS